MNGQELKLKSKDQRWRFFDFVALSLHRLIQTLIRCAHLIIIGHKNLNNDLYNHQCVHAGSEVIGKYWS